MEKNLTSSEGMPASVWTANGARAANGADASPYRWVALFIVWAAFLLS